MNELDRIYEEIERLLEAKDVLYNATENSEINKDLINKLENNFNCKFDYIGKNGQVVFKDNNTNESRPLKKDDRGFIIAQKYNTNKGQQHIPEKDENATSSFMNNVLGQTSPTTPAPSPAEEKSLALSNGNSLAAKEQSGVPAANGAYQAEYETVDNPEESSEKEKSLTTSDSDNGISALNSVPSNSWEDGTWKNLCNKEEDGYYYLNDDAGARILADNQDFKPSEAQQINKKDSQWYSLYKYNNGQWQKTEPTLVNNGNKSILNPDDIVEQEEIPDAAAEVLNTNTQLNYRLKAVIDSPDIQKQIDASPNGINYVGLNGDKISLITVTEKFSIPKELNIPDFLSRIIESKEAEISSIGAGGQSNLNVFLTPEIQKYLQSKGNPTITKVMLGKDGLVWLMDNKNNPILLDDMGVNNEVSTKGQEGNSLNVFINNGGVNKDGEAGAGNSSDASADGTNNVGPSGKEISLPIKMSELKELVPAMQKQLEPAKNEISKYTFENKEGYELTINNLRLGKVINGTVLNEAGKVTKEDNEETEEKKKVPQTTGDCEIYIMETFTISQKETQESQTEKSSEESEEVPEEAEETEEDANALNEEDIYKLLISSRDSVVESLNNGNLSLTHKTKDETTFTGNKKQITNFQIVKGDDNKIGLTKGFESFKLGEPCEGYFTIIVLRDNDVDTKGTKFNRIMNTVTGAAGVIDKLAHNGNGPKTNYV